MNDDLLKFQHRVDQRANGLAEDMIRELEAVRARLVGKLAILQDDILKGGSFEDMALSRRKELLEAQKAEVERVLAEVYSSVKERLEEAVDDTIQASAAHAAGAMKAATGLRATFGRLEADVVKAWFETATVDGLIINEWLAKLERGAVDRIVSASRQALIEGLGSAATARLIRTTGIEGSVPGLEGLARTSLMSASNYAREQIVEKSFGDVLKGWRRVGTLDDRTCLRCGVLDGRFYGREETKPPATLHWNCRCLYVPATSDKEISEAVTRAAVKNDSRTVHHRDGSTSTKFKAHEIAQVPARTTYQQWLKGQLEEDPDFVKSVLGPQRFKLFASGKMSLDRMATTGRIKKLS